MFNSYTTVNKTITNKNFPDVMEVHEHKAPTDQSISILKSMEEETRKSLIKSWNFTIRDNSMEGGIYLFEKPHDMVIVEVIHFYLNGKEYFVERYLPHKYYSNYDARRRFAEVMTEAIIQELVKGMDNK